MVKKKMSQCSVCHGSQTAANSANAIKSVSKGIIFHLLMRAYLDKMHMIF